MNKEGDKNKVVQDLEDPKPSALSRIKRNKRKLGTNIIGQTSKNRKVREQFFNKERKLENCLEQIGSKITQSNIIVDTCLRYLNPEPPKLDKDDPLIQAISKSSMEQSSQSSIIGGKSFELPIPLGNMLNANFGRTRKKRENVKSVCDLNLQKLECQKELIKDSEISCSVLSDD